MVIERIYLGYWYPRTTLHLAELYDFFTSGKSPLELDPQKLYQLKDSLQIKKVELAIGALEYIQIDASEGIVIKIYEDGLVTLSNDFTDLKQDIAQLGDYFEKQFSPAVSYLFSLGAPVPKELANIHTQNPYFIVTSGITDVQAATILTDLGGGEYFELSGNGINVYSGHNLFIINHKKDPQIAEALVENLVFFKEFKTQLHHYLNMHRKIWERIAEVKERGQIRGKEVRILRNRLESYKKTVELIEGRIEQMGMYMTTRSSVAKNSPWGDLLTNTLQFKYDNLAHSHGYIKALWNMTKQYINSAIEIFAEINQLATRSSVQALTLISSIGVIAGLLGYLAAKDYPAVTGIGFIYFGILLVAAVAMNHLVGWLFARAKYKISDIKLAKDI